MDTKTEKIQEMLTQLRKRFLSQMEPRTVKAMQQLDLAANDWRGHMRDVTDLHRFFHGVKGTGNSFGFHQLADIASANETILYQYLQNGLEPDAEDIATLGLNLKKMHTEVELLQGLSETHQEEIALESYIEDVPIRKKNSYQPKAQPRVYLCDYDKEHMNFLAYQMQCFGYNVTQYNSLSELKIAILQKIPDVILLDSFFPNENMSGIDVLNELSRQLNTVLPSVVLAQNSDFFARLNAMRSGCKAFFSKPVNLIELASSLDELFFNAKEEEPFRILIVDDEIEVAAYHKEILSSVGMVVEYLSKPDFIVETLQRFNPDLVLADMYMQDCTGPELAGVVRQLPQYVGLPIIFLSGETDKRIQFQAMRIGVDGFLTKPVIPDELIAAVSLRAERMSKLRSLMSQDPLTGLFNHTTTKAFLSSALAQAKRQHELVTLVMIDLDNFKLINDTYGHVAGDEVLFALARALKRRFRASDILGRYGGEEFVIVLRNIDEHQAKEIIEEFRRDFSSIEFKAGEECFSCSFSAGVSTFPVCDNSDLLRTSADQALYLAKSNGRNRTEIYRGENA